MGLFGSTFLLPLFLQSSLNYTVLQSGLVFFPVGVIQAIMSPISGIMSDKINPKVPAFLGVVLLALGLFLNSHLSLWSEHSQIMVALYVRGFGMGLLFTPLSTIALNGIPKRKMAQASGLFNVIRQIGGSFGVAIFGALLTRRIIFHNALNGEAVNQYSAQFKSIQYGLQGFAKQATGGNAAEISMKAKALIGQHVVNQSFVQAINDDFFLAGALTLLCIIPILFLRIKKKKKGEKIAVME